MRTFLGSKQKRNCQDNSLDLHISDSSGAISSRNIFVHGAFELCQAGPDHYSWSILGIMPGCVWIRENLLGFGCSLQWVYGGLSQFTSQFFPHKFFEGMPTGIYVTQRLEDWNFVGLT